MADYLGVANAARPQMMPSAPLGAGGVAGMMYGQDQRRHDELLQQAAAQAEMEAQRKAMEAEEFSLAQPGRLAGINLKNVSSQDNLDAYNQDGMGRQNAMGEVENKGLAQKEEIRKLLAPLFNALGGEDEDQARSAYEEIVSNVPRFKSMSYEKMRKEAKARLAGKTKSDPAQQNKVQIETIKETGRNTRSAEAIASREKLAQARLQFAKITAEAKAAQAAGKPLTPGQQEVLDVTAMYDTPEERVAYWFGKSQNTASTAVAAGKAKTAQNLGVEGVSPPVTSSPPPAKAGSTPKPENFVVLPEGAQPPKVGETHNGKKVKRVQQGKSTGRFRVEYE